MFRIWHLEEVEDLLRGVGHDVEYEERALVVWIAVSRLGRRKGHLKWKAEEYIISIV
jgi:hypothetical protein